MRRLALFAGLALVVLAFAAATRVSDTREGLVAEIITLLGGAAGVSLLIYAFAARPRERQRIQPPSTSQPQTASRPRSRNDLFLGAAGIATSVLLLGGLAFSAGFPFVLLGAVVLLPMAAGSVYLCVRYARASP